MAVNKKHYTLAKNLRNNATNAERHLWQKLRKSQLYQCKFRRQFSIGRYIADFACFNPKLIIEIDGGQHSENKEYDQKRDEWLQSQGFTVLRFWNNQVLNETDAVVEEILKNLPPPPNPLQ